jgi:hypothetical protein
LCFKLNSLARSCYCGIKDDRVACDLSVVCSDELKVVCSDDLSVVCSDDLRVVCSDELSVVCNDCIHRRFNKTIHLPVFELKMQTNGGQTDTR